MPVIQSPQPQGLGTEGQRALMLGFLRTSWTEEKIFFFLPIIFGFGENSCQLKTRDNVRVKTPQVKYSK